MLEHRLSASTWQTNRCSCNVGGNVATKPGRRVAAAARGSARHESGTERTDPRKVKAYRQLGTRGEGLEEATVTQVSATAAALAMLQARGVVRGIHFVTSMTRAIAS